MTWFRTLAGSKFVIGRMDDEDPPRLWLTDEYWEWKSNREWPDPPLVPSLFNLSLACMRDSYTEGIPKLIGFGYYQQNQRLLEIPDILHAASEEDTKPGSSTLAIEDLMGKIKELWLVLLALKAVGRIRTAQHP